MNAGLFANAVAPWPLRAGVVHVWRFTCAQPVGDHAGWLAVDERERAARFVQDHHRDAYVTQHVMLRAIVARYVASDPAAIEFARGRHGKPYIPGSGLELNLSHTDDVAVLAVARVAVGVDVERLDAKLDPPALARMVLAPDEHAIAVDRRGFLRVWCRKEACLKATGVGLIDDLPSVSVVNDRVDVDGHVVYVQDLALGDAHAGALATSEQVAPISPVEQEVVRFT